QKPRRHASAFSNQRIAQSDRVLHCELGPGADREMRRMRGVAEQNEVIVMPTSIADSRKAAPDAAVFEQPVTRELRCEQALQVADGIVLGRGFEPRAPPRLLAAFDDEGRAVLGITIGVHPEQAVFALFEIERECVEWKSGSQPNEAIRAEVDDGFERVRKALSDAAVGAVTRHDQVGPEQLPRVIELALELELYAELASARLQDGEQALSTETAEAVPGRRRRGACEVNVDVVPASQAVTDRAVTFGIGLTELVDGCV